MMRQFLKSTYGQLTLMFGLLLLINFVVIMLSLRQLTFKPAATQFALLIDNQINSIKPLLLNKDFEGAKKLIEQAFPNHKITIKQQVSGKPLPALLFYQTLSEQLKNSQSPQLKILIQESPVASKIWVKPVWLTDFWLGIAFQPFMKKVSWLVVLLFLTLLILSLLAAFLFSRYMLKPFKQLANMAVDIVEQNPDNKDIPITGTTEIKAITQLVRTSAQQIQQLTKEKELLLAGVSHDLRTPLARMRLQAEFLDDTTTQDALIEDIEEMDAIISDFVAYVRSGSYEETQKRDVVKIIQQTIDQYSTLGEMIEFKTATPAVLLEIKPLCLKRMLTNIIDNAYKYGKPPVQLTLEETPTHCTIEIIDHGKGLNTAELETIFDPFVMAQSTDNQYGSGLGLSIVKKLAEQNNAQVTAHNHSQGGLCVCIEIAKS